MYITLPYCHENAFLYEMCRVGYLIVTYALLLLYINKLKELQKFVLIFLCVDMGSSSFF